MKKLSAIVQKLRKNIHRKVIFRLRFFALIFFIIFSLVVFKVLKEDVNLLYVMIGFLLGTGLGLVFGRINKTHWHPRSGKIIMKMDKKAIFLLLIYILIEAFRKWFFSHWLHGATLNAVVLIFAAGLILGRLITIIKNINKLLRTNYSGNTKHL